MRNLILCIGFVVISLASVAQKQKYFEGIVEYDIISTSHIQGVTDNEIRDRFGSKMRLYFKNGDYIREYLDDAGYVLRKFYSLKDKKMVYDHNVIGSPDTIYTIDPAEKMFESYTIKKGGKEKVLDYECASSIINVRYVSSFLPDTGTVVMTYFFASELPVDPDWHKHVYIWSDVIKDHKSISIKFIEEDPALFKQVYTATKISWQPVSDDMFKIDPKLIQVKAPKL